MTDRPNIIFLLPDQLRLDFLSAYGAQFIDTPNIDSLAAEGVRYDRAYSGSPVCVPARTALLTGMNAVRNGVTDNLHRIRSDYAAAGVATWPGLLAGAGYYTSAIGKMHFYPWDARHGFQRRVICEDKRWLEVRDDYYHYLRERGLRKLHGNEHEGYFENRGAITHALPREHSWDRFVGREACHFIKNYGEDGPFAMMVGFPGPHCPYDPPSDFPEVYDPEDMPASIPEAPGDTPLLRQNNIEGNKRPWNGVDYSEFTEEHKKKIRAHYAGLVKGIDYEVGLILESLRSQDLMDNTIIVFATDHADYLGDHNLIGKASFYETCMRIPLIVRVPGAKASASDALVELRDVTATMLAFAGVARPANMDSRTLPGLPISADGPRDRIFGLLTDGWMIMDGQYKLARYSTGESVLFDLSDDPDEQCNLIADPAHAETLRRLDAELTAYLMEEMRLSMFDRLAQSGDMSQDPAFGREGWSQPFPAPVEFISQD
jgi:arylsulfatase